MKQIYTALKALCTASAFFVAFETHAQAPTYVANSGNCTNVVANFNTTDNGFNSPSIYGGAFDSAFYFNNARGWWTEAAGGQYTEKTFPQGTPRFTSIISPVYPNPNPQGTFDVGFFYRVGNAYTDRFQVRIVSASPQGTFTVYNVEATSGPQSFAQFSVSTPLSVTTETNPYNNGMEGFVCIRLNDADITNAPGVQYRVEVIYLLNTVNYAVFDNLSLGGTAAAPLPVTFMGIAANRTNNNIILKWDVGEEINVKEYEVERSFNGGTFTTVGTVGANGKHVYSFTDATNEKNTIYYRLKSVDNDGRTKYSGIVKVKGTGNSYATTLKLYPLPARNEVTLEHKKLSPGAQITVNTMDGRAVRVINPSPGASHTPIDISNMMPGIYLVRLSDGDGNMETVKLVKQ